MTTTITAIFDSRKELEAAVRKLDNDGITVDQVTLLTSHDGRSRHFGFVEGDKASEGAVAGATVGGLFGALYLGLATTGALLIPGINLIASGALIGTLAGLGAGAATGGIVGALVGMGIPEHEAKLYEDKLKGGAMLLAIEVTDDEMEEKVRAHLDASNAVSVQAAAA